MSLYGWVWVGSHHESKKGSLIKVIRVGFGGVGGQRIIRQPPRIKKGVNWFSWVGFWCFGCFRDGFGCQRIIRHPPKFEITVRGWVRGRRILREPPEILITIFRWVEWV